MSVKQMTTDQLQDDLESIANTWPGGIPPEQNDRVNALKGELKRRGEPLRAARAKQTSNGNGAPKDIGSMTDAQLEKELRELSQSLGANPKDEDSQNRFADVRFEMRKRAKAAPAEQVPPASPSVSPRAIEIPNESEVETKVEVARKVARDPGVKGITASPGGKGVIVKYTAQDQFGNIAQVASMMSIEEAEQLVQHFQAAVDAAKQSSKGASS